MAGVSIGTLYQYFPSKEAILAELGRRHAEEMNRAVITALSIASDARELSKEDAIELAREFVEAEFVAEGMIADLNVHWGIGKDGEAKPHAHVMLTMREVVGDRFGSKVREWNRSELIEIWRERWADHVNRALAERDIDARIDHRSLADQGIALEPQDKIGPAASRIGGRGLEAERIEEHRAIAQRNGDAPRGRASRRRARRHRDPRLRRDAVRYDRSDFLT